MKGLKRNVAIYFAANIAVAIIPFLLLPVLARYLGPKGYGIVAMFLTLVTTLSSVVGLNSHSALSTRWFDREECDFSQYVASCLLILLVSAVFVGVLFLILEQWLASKLSIPVFWLYASVIVAASSFLVQVRLVIWQVQEKPIQYGSLQFGQGFINGVLSYTLVVIFLKDYEGRLWGQLITVFLFGILSFFLLCKERILSYRTQWSYIKDTLAFGVPLIPHVVGSFFLLIADRIIINVKLGTSSVGIYMVAVQISLGFCLLNESIAKAMVPWLFSRLKSGDVLQKRVIVKFTYISFLLLLTVPLITIFIGKYIILLLAGPKFEQAIPVLFWLILMQSFHGMYYMVTNYLFFKRKTCITSIITIVCGSLNVVLALFLVESFGLVGAGVASAISMLMQFLLTWIMAARVYPMPWFSWAFFQRQNAKNTVVREIN